MVSSDSDSSGGYIRRKRHNDRKHKDRSRDRREKSRSRGRDRSRSRHRDRKDKKRRHRSRSSSSSSYSSSRKNKNKNKKRDDRKHKYEDEINELKDKERLKRLEVENKRKEEEERKKKEELMKEENKVKEVLTEEEKMKRKKQSRYAKAIAVALLESADEKKNEVLKNDEMEDFLMDKGKKKEFMIVDELEKFDEIPHSEKNETSNKIEEKITPVEIEQILEETNIPESKSINLSFTTFGSINKKLPQLPKEFLSSSKSSNSVFKQENSIKKPIVQQPVNKVEEEEDPLDAFMKTIEKEAVIQDYELVQMMNRQQLQRQYDEIAEKEDTVKMIDQEIDYNEGNVDPSKIITLDDILGKNSHLKGSKEQNDVEMAMEKEVTTTSDENQDEFHKKFVESLMQTKAPEFDPILGYTYIDENKKENIIYQEDANEYLKEEDFLDTEEAWIKAKKSGEKTKELKLVNHAEIKYEEFRKNLYKETKEISNLSEEDIVNYRKEHGDIKVRGKNIPKPIFNWYQCGLSDKIIAVLEKKAYKQPFPIQAQAIPTIMSGRDIIGIAETGSGKTLAYLLPMLRHVIDQRPLKDGEGPISLIFAPTRELASQIYSVLKIFCKILNLNVSCVYGGSGIGAQISELRRGAEIVVCTPGRMIEILCINNGKITNLQRVTYVIIDEADRMFDMGFEPQLSRILANIRPDRQTVMFSATFPKQIENLAKKILNKPVEIVVGQRGQSCSNVTQYVEVLDDNQKLLRLLQILGEYSDCFYEEADKKTPFGIIIFVDQQTEADELYKEIFQRGYQALLIHGGQDQEDRNFAIYDFKTGVRNILISTSVCARGLDVKHCGLVINFKCPNHMEDYIHRVGRTGRAGRKGVAYTFISKEEAHLAEDIVRVLEVSKQNVDDELLELIRIHREKVESGEADKHRISGYWGRGYEFSQKERDSAASSRKELGRGYLMLLGEDEEAEIKGDSKKEGENKEQIEVDKKKSLTALALLKKSQDLQTFEDKRKALLKDKQAQQIALDVGANAVKNAIIAGKTEEEALQIAQEAIEKVLAEYIPSVSAEKGAEQAAKVIEEWVERENIKNNIFTCEFEINEYPSTARSKVVKKEFISSISEMSACTVSLRGVFVEPNKKPASGQKKLHLYIQGNSKQDVLKAHREIKQVLDESALNYYTMGTGANAGRLGKYTI